MRVVIFGAGSIGGYVGARLTRSGVGALLVDPWHAHVQSMRQHGLRLTTAAGGDEVVAVECVSIGDLHRIGTGSIDLAILCVKSYETRWMSTLLLDYLAPDGAVLSMQNGMNEEAIAAIVGRQRVLGCTLTRLGTELVRPGFIHRWLGPPDAAYPVFRVGELHGRLSQRVEKVVELLSAVDKAVPTQNIWGERWSKLIQNAMVSGISPLTHQGINELLSSPVMLPKIVALVKEGIAVGQAQGYSLEKICGVSVEAWNAPNNLVSGAELAMGLDIWRRNMGPGGEPSTLHDIRRRRRTEIDGINGLIARKAADAGVSAPLHTLLWQEVLAEEKRAANEPRYTETELEGLLHNASG